MTASIIGVEYAYLLLWTIAFSILATMVVQKSRGPAGQADELLRVDRQGYRQIEDHRK